MSMVDGVLRNSLRDELTSIGFLPVVSKLYQPAPGTVSRSQLVRRVRAADASLVLVTAPAGYGKSSFVAELTAGDLRPTAWVSLGSTDSDPAVLLTYVALALDAIEPIEPDCLAGLWTHSATMGSPGLQRFAAMLAARHQPFILVLDDLQEVSGRDAFDALGVVVNELPAGSTLVLVSRSAIPLRLARFRARSRLVEVGLTQLAFANAEAAELFAALDVTVPETQTARLVERTEGWPVALYLAALAYGSGGAPVNDIVDEPRGDHRYLVDYLGEELLDALDEDVSKFLLEASCLERQSGSLCDWVLEREGSARLLDGLQRHNMLVIPLDDRREWYRFHHLMSESLRAELSIRDPQRASAVHLRASEWFDTHGDADGAVRHAILSGDMDTAESVVLRWHSIVGTAGRRYPRTERWVAMFPPAELARRPSLTVIAAWADYLGGRPASALRWMARAAGSLPAPRPNDVDGFVAAVAIAEARSIISLLTPAEMAADAIYAYEHVGLGEGHPTACLAWGAAAMMLGKEVEARRRLREGADTALDRPLVVAHCLALLTLIDIEHEDWTPANDHGRRARTLLGEGGDLPATVIVRAVSVLVETHAGRHREVEADRLVCRQQLASIAGMAPWLNLHTRIALTRAALIRGDRTEAAALLNEIEAILADTSGAVHIAEQLATLRREATTPGRNAGFGPSSLSTAELRVLQLLPTHLSVRAIAERLYVSNNTVKSQTISIYRKLGASSRSEAVEVATAAGLLAPALRHP
jgi:LuxR family maltose regulon positive regulatory protein